MRSMKVVSLTAAVIALSLTGCEYLLNADSGECGSYSSEYQTLLEAGGVLQDSIPVEANAYPMALVLNTRALNDMFSRLSNTSLPELTDSTNVLGQSVGVGVQPAIPLFAINTDVDCAGCIMANVPFDIGVSLNNSSLSRGSGSISVQLPVRLIPGEDNVTSLVAEFQNADILQIDLDLGDGVASSIFNAVEPLASSLLTDYLQSRFQDAQIARMEPWAIGQGEVLLAGRGPFIFQEEGSMVIAMQSNLNLDGLPTIEADAVLPEGADMGIVFHPEVLGAMARRMTFEGEISQSYDDEGQPATGGAMQMTMGSIEADESGLLRTSSTLWRTGSLCGSADIAASMGLTAGTDGFGFSISNIEVNNGRGYGALLEQGASLADGYVNQLAEIMAVTVNYDQIFGGEAEERSEMGAFQSSIDARGVTAYFNLLSGE